MQQYELFINSLRSQYTKRVYTIVFQKYLDFIGQNESDVFCQNNPRLIEHKIIDFIISLRNKGLGHSAISNYVKAIIAFYKINDFVLNTEKISKFIPEYRKMKKDRAYTHQEIHRLLDFADERLRVVIYILASTGMRIGAIPGLRLRNLEKISTDSDLAIYKITVYEGFKDEYVTFTTPECSKAIDAYLDMRKIYGEKLTADSFLIREQFDIRDPPKKSKAVKAETLARKIYDLSTRSGVRNKEVLEEGKMRSTIRRDVPVAHGFRKFFTTQLIEADLKTELRWLLEGHKLKGNDSHYIRISENVLLEEYLKGIDNLTIDPSNRQQRTIETLKIEKSRIDMLEAKIQKLERKHMAK